MNYVLILTLVFMADNSNAGYGGAGIATASFNTLESCQNAAKEWAKDTKIDGKYAFINTFKRSAICVKK